MEVEKLGLLLLNELKYVYFLNLLFSFFSSGIPKLITFFYTYFFKYILKIRFFLNCKQL